MSVTIDGKTHHEHLADQIEEVKTAMTTLAGPLSTKFDSSISGDIISDGTLTIHWLSPYSEIGFEYKDTGTYYVTVTRGSSNYMYTSTVISTTPDYYAPDTGSQANVSYGMMSYAPASVLRIVKAGSSDFGYKVEVIVNGADSHISMEKII